MPAPLIDIAVDGPAAEVLPHQPRRTLARHPHQVARRRTVDGPVEGGGRSAGYFTGATGITIYRGNAFRPDFVGNAFIGDAGGNLVHRKKLQPDGVDRQSRSARPTNRNANSSPAPTTGSAPCNFANAPDGCLYVIDMYRETIEHPWSLPERIKKYLDLNNGNDRGRIYRIVPQGFEHPAPCARSARRPKNS